MDYSGSHEKTKRSAELEGRYNECINAVKELENGQISE